MALRIFLMVMGLTTFLAAASAAEPSTSGIDTPWGRVELFPKDHPFNTPVDRLPVHPRSAALIESIGAEKNLHPDFGMTWKGAPSGIPYVVVGPDQPRVPVE